MLSRHAIKNTSDRTWHLTTVLSNLARFASVFHWQRPLLIVTDFKDAISLFCTTPQRPFRCAEWAQAAPPFTVDPPLPHSPLLSAMQPRKRLSERFLLHGTTPIFRFFYYSDISKLWRYLRFISTRFCHAQKQTVHRRPAVFRHSYLIASRAVDRAVHLRLVLSDQRYFRWSTAHALTQAS